VSLAVWAEFVCCMLQLGMQEQQQVKLECLLLLA
jgi:hypothetical protein